VCGCQKQVNKEAEMRERKRW